MKAASTAIIVLGLVMIGGSFFWSKIAPQPAPLTEEKETEYLKAMGDLHSRPSEVTEQSKALVDEVSETGLRAERMRTMGTNILKFGGILVALLGVGVYVWASRSAEA